MVSLASALEPEFLIRLRYLNSSDSAEPAHCGGAALNAGAANGAAAGADSACARPGDFSV